MASHWDNYYTGVLAQHEYKIERKIKDYKKTRNVIELLCFYEIYYSYDPDYLLDEDIVLVTINYRLGMFGFMSTEDREAGGNYGMLDQVKHIKYGRKYLNSSSNMYWGLY